MHFCSNKNLRNWLGLSHCAGVGPVKFSEHLQLSPNLDELPVGIKPDWRAVDQDLAWQAKTPDAKILTLTDPEYPSLLKNIAAPPPILYVRGDLEYLRIPQIAMVGSRNPSTIGVQYAEFFAKHFAHLGFIVTSGLAAGIDAASHIGALAAADGKTIAVLGHGLDRIYPWQHKKLADEIISRGCLVTEFPIHTEPLAHNFPRRNRIISGLSLGVLVVEARLESGSLITAKYAAEQGREVFAIPGAINNPKVMGCHQIIRQGAKLVEKPEDVLEELTALLNYVIRDKKATANTQGLKVTLSAAQQGLLQHVNYETTNIDKVIYNSGLSASEVGSILMELELNGFIAAVPGGYLRKLG